MFAFFKNESLVNFWANQVGDIFFDLTIRGMKWSESEIDLIYYPFLDQVPEFYEFGPDKNLIIKKKVITFVDSKSTIEDGSEVTTTSEVVSFEVERTIIPMVYFSKGISFLPC
jgi:hypothetical protein